MKRILVCAALTAAIALGGISVGAAASSTAPDHGVSKRNPMDAQARMKKKKKRMMNRDGMQGGSMQGGNMQGGGGMSGGMQGSGMSGGGMQRRGL